MSQPIISVIICMHNSEKTIGHCIKSVITQNYPREKFEILVIDNGSTDRSVEIAKVAADLVIKSEAHSIGYLRNIGCRKAKGKFLAFIDSDCLAMANWLKTITNELDVLDAISGSIENGKDNPISWSEYFLNHSEYNRYKERGKVFFGLAGNQAFTRKSFELTGGFPDIISSEDILFSNLLKQNGIFCHFIPEMQIQHLGVSDKKKLLTKMKQRGIFFIRTRTENKELPHAFLTNDRLFIFIIFFGKIFFRIRYAIQARKFKKFLLCLPIILPGISSFCKGAWEELSK